MLTEITRTCIDIHVKMSFLAREYCILGRCVRHLLHMSHLSKGLLRFYTKIDRRIFFRNSLTLHTLSLNLWQDLGFREIDESVLSRVLQGKRLFTPKQLDVFLKHMRANFDEAQFLSYCLLKDICERRQGTPPQFFLSPNHAVYLIQGCMDKFRQLANEERKRFLEEKQKFIETLLTILTFQSPRLTSSPHRESLPPSQSSLLLQPHASVL